MNFPTVKNLRASKNTPVKDAIRQIIKQNLYVYQDDFTTYDAKQSKFLNFFGKLLIRVKLRRLLAESNITLSFHPLI